MFATGFAVFLALLFIFVKLPRRLMLRLLRYDLAIDLVVTIAVLFIHGGSFEGVMAATIAGLFTSVATTAAKHLVGYIKGDTYVPGLLALQV